MFLGWVGLLLKTVTSARCRDCIVVGPNMTLFGLVYNQSDTHGLIKTRNGTGQQIQDWVG